MSASAQQAAGFQGAAVGLAGAAAAEANTQAAERRLKRTLKRTHQFSFAPDLELISIFDSPFAAHTLLDPSLIQLRNRLSSAKIEATVVPVNSPLSVDTRKQPHAANVLDLRLLGEGAPEGCVPGTDLLLPSPGHSSLPFRYIGSSDCASLYIELKCNHLASDSTLTISVALLLSYVRVHISAMQTHKTAAD